ncbi:GOLPH3/VPS74 family protein [Streptomyces sp. MMBL 11-3]|uniref:GOLPH3/VPS74 family protein n=1 Tax=Streptomyces sp. MMBL 11-3 TaxID=3382639 RepID=UPI0039B3B20B
MTTPRDLLISTMDVGSDRPAGQGDLSLALAGAELVDLGEAGVLALDGDRIVPAEQGRGELGDGLLEEAASALHRQEPYESVEDWLWRRGRDLSATYLAALRAEGQVTRPRHGWNPFRDGEETLTDSPARRHAAARRTADEPVLAFLTAAVGLRDEPEGEVADHVDDAVVTVLAAVNDAVRELEAVRQRRSIENAAFDNIWRGQ